MIDIDRFEQFSKILLQINREITRLKTKHMSKFGLGSTQVMCIVALERRGPLTAGEMAAAEDVDKAQMSRVLSDLMKKEIITILEEEDNKKYKKHYKLTEEGRKIAREIKKILQDIIDYVDAGLDDREIDIMHRNLLLINRNIEKASKEFD